MRTALTVLLVVVGILALVGFAVLGVRATLWPPDAVVVWPV